jgi:hypothetical protein
MSGTFEDCESLKKAPKIPENVTSLDNTFSGCRSLKKAPDIPENVTNMTGTFEGCHALRKAPLIPPHVKSMRDTFSACRFMKEPPSIPLGVKDMTGTFMGCTSLTKAPIIPNGIKNLDNTFSGCRSMKIAPEIPTSVTSLHRTFADCFNLEKAPFIPGSVTNMTGTFANCRSLTTKPRIPNGVTNAHEAFENCGSLEHPTRETEVADKKTNDYEKNELKSPFTNPSMHPSTSPMLPNVTNLDNKKTIPDAGMFLISFPQGKDIRTKLVNKLNDIMNHAKEIMGLEEHTSADKQQIYVSKEVNKDDDVSKSSAVVIYRDLHNGTDAVKKAIEDVFPQVTIDSDTYSVLEVQMESVEKHCSVKNDEQTKIKMQSDINSKQSVKLDEELLQQNKNTDKYKDVVVEPNL